MHMSSIKNSGCIGAFSLNQLRINDTLTGFVTVQKIVF